VHGAGPVDGVCSKYTQFDTQVELFGSAALNEFLFHFMKYYKIESTSKCVKCVDNRVAISQANWTQDKHSCRCQYSDDVDIVTVIINH
jgi:hypothetical protein